jgi:acetyl-CoA carboxylase biotin carboxyl carrier protein
VPHIAYAPARGPAAAPAGGGEAVLTAASEDVDLAIIKSPIVGTFYRRPSRAPSRSRTLGSSAQRQVLCIIEAMS